MDDRDKDLTHLFVRDLDEIPLPARGAWRRVSGRETIAMRSSRYLLTAGAVVAVLAIALIIGLQLNQRQQNAAFPSASPTASASPATVANPTASQSATATPPAATGTPPPGGAIYNDAFGFIVAPGSNSTAATIRKESTIAPVATFDQQGFAVSPDGTRIAYWTPESNSTRSELRVVTAAAPSSPQFSSSLSANEHGGGIAWSSDGTSLLYTVNTGDPTTSSTIRMVDLRSGGAAQVVLTSNAAGVILKPIAWSSSTHVAAVGETGEGGFMSTYDVINFTSNPPTSTRANVPVQIPMSSVTASSDALFAVGLDLNARGFTYWPLQTMSGAGHHPPESKYGVTGFAWRPGTHEIGFIGPSNQFWLCDVDKENPLGCGRTAFSGVSEGAFVKAFRADGSAVLLQSSTAPAFGQATYTLVTFTNDPFAAKATGGERVTFTDVGGLGGSGIAASVRFR